MKALFEEVQKKGRNILTEVEAKEVLQAAGIPVVETYLTKSGEEAKSLAARMGFPVVLKVCSADIVHKTEAGGVLLNLTCAEDVSSAYEHILKTAAHAYPQAVIDGVTVQKMIDGGVELVMGMSTDPQFGPMIMFGFGGIFVEVLRDVSFRIVPLTEEDATEMINEIKGRALLEGVRGTMPVKKEALVDILLKLSRLLEANPEIKELDINPLFANSEGAIAADARIIID